MTNKYSNSFKNICKMRVLDAAEDMQRHLIMPPWSTRGLVA
jgi:hypothetical protein